jgi:Fe2+ or Zn2+ uptake regulation protein
MDYYSQLLTLQLPDSNYFHVINNSNKILKADTADENIKAQRRYFMSRCSARGIRMTTQRLAVFQALAQTAAHPTADWLYSILRKIMPALSLSTVYRILESLEREGLIRRVSANDGLARYDAKLAPHQHLVCRLCGRITDFENNSFSLHRLSDIHVDGFIAEELDIRILGICLDCRPRQSKLAKTFNKRSGDAMSSRKRRKADGGTKRD